MECSSAVGRPVVEWLMSRSRYGLLLLALLAPACQTAGPKAPPAAPMPPPDLLRPYEGALRVLPHGGDERVLTLRPGESLTGECDVAVRVRSVAFDKGTTRFALETLGLPKVGERRVKCKRVEPAIQLVLTGSPSGPVTPELTARIDQVLLTPEAYLQASGTAFDRAPGEAPSDVASRQSDANDGERRLARAVVAWPRLLLSVDPTYRAPSGHAHFERLVDGRSGRRHRREASPAAGEDVPRPPARGGGPERAAVLAARARAARRRAGGRPHPPGARAPRLLRALQYPRSLSTTFRSARPVE